MEDGSSRQQKANQRQSLASPFTPLLYCRKRCVSSKGKARGNESACSTCLSTVFIIRLSICLSVTSTSGLGVGIAAGTFIHHGLSTTVIEIDPAVYRFAREYFDLPEPEEVYLEDARGWVHRRPIKSKTQSQSDVDAKFDFVIHDCFSGGGVPEHIFTVEFWEDLKVILDSTGVVAVVCSLFACLLH